MFVYFMMFSVHCTLEVVIACGSLRPARLAERVDKADPPGRLGQSARRSVAVFLLSLSPVFQTITPYLNKVFTNMKVKMHNISIIYLTPKFIFATSRSSDWMIIEMRLSSLSSSFFSSDLLTFFSFFRFFLILTSATV